MKSFGRYSVLTAAILLGAAPVAFADFELQLSTDGTTWTTEASGASGTLVAFSDVNFGGYDITLLNGQSNSPGTPSDAQLLGATLNIQNNTASTPLYIKIGDTGFTNPKTPPALNLSSSIGGSYTTSDKTSGVLYQSYVDSTNGQNSTSGFTPGPQNVNFANSGGVGTSDSFNSTATSGIASLTTTFSITEYLKVTLAQHDSMGFNARTELTTPEPASVMLWGLGLVACGIVARRRHRA